MNVNHVHFNSPTLFRSVRTKRTTEWFVIPMSQHMKMHSEEKTHACPHPNCNYKSKWRDNLKTHLRTHSGERPYECTLCDSAFAQSQHLNKHMRTHTRETPYACQLCNFKTNSGSYLKVHQRIHQKSNECQENDLNLLSSISPLHFAPIQGSFPCKISSCSFSRLDDKEMAIHLSKSHNSPQIIISRICN